MDDIHRLREFAKKSGTIPQTFKQGELVHLSNEDDVYTYGDDRINHRTPLIVNAFGERDGNTPVSFVDGNGIIRSTGIATNRLQSFNTVNEDFLVIKIAISRNISPDTAQFKIRDWLDSDPRVSAYEITGTGMREVPAWAES